MAQPLDTDVTTVTMTLPDGTTFHVTDDGSDND